MNGATLLDLTTEILGGEVLGDVLFYQFLNQARRQREMKRDWFFLRKKDTSLSWLTTDSINVAKTLPSDFVRTIKETKYATPIVLLDATTGKKVGTATEIPMERQYDFQDSVGYFFIDATPALHFTAAAPTTRSVALFYIADDGDITDATEWSAPTAFHPLLAWDVANMYKGGIDFDEINARMVQYAGVDADSLFTAMIMDDDRRRLGVLGV